MSEPTQAEQAWERFKADNGIGWDRVQEDLQYEACIYGYERGRADEKKRVEKGAVIALRAFTKLNAHHTADHHDGDPPVDADIAAGILALRSLEVGGNGGLGLRMVSLEADRAEAAEREAATARATLERVQSTLLSQMEHCAANLACGITRQGDLDQATVLKTCEAVLAVMDQERGR